MAIKIILLVLLSTILASSAGDLALKAFALGNWRFTSDVYKSQLNIQGNNIIVSPLSAQTVMALISEGAHGTTATELTKALRLPSKIQTEKAVKSLQFDISSETLKVLSANKIYVAKNFKLLQSFVELAKVVYKAGIRNVNFGNNVGTSDLINAWVAQRTNNKIQNLVSPDQISSETRIVLVNTLYFSGRWSSPFNTKDTIKENFYVSPDTDKKVDMMHSGDFFKYHHSFSLKAKFLELSYEDSNITMTFVLSDARNGLSSMERNLEKYLEPQNMLLQKVAVSLPKFTIRSSIDFKNIMLNLGVQKLFRVSANLSGISKEGGLRVDNIFQKTFIDVSETGTEAAAATEVIGGRALPKPPVLPPSATFNADHPFFFYIKDSRSEVILFCGKYIN